MCRVSSVSKFCTTGYQNSDVSFQWRGRETKDQQRFQRRERTKNKRSVEISTKREDEKQKISRDFNEERGREKKKEKRSADISTKR